MYALVQLYVDIETVIDDFEIRKYDLSSFSIDWCQLGFLVIHLPLEVIGNWVGRQVIFCQFNRNRQSMYCLPNNVSLNMA